jgi:peptide-methionine (S)-S-oxide reductase
MQPKYTIPMVAALLGAAVIGVLWESMLIDAADAPFTTPPPKVDEEPFAAQLETAVFAGGCFWGVEAAFRHIRGVASAVSGYAGGTVPDPTYDQVSTGQTGHAETVRVTFDPTAVSYGTLLRVFFSIIHDPTQIDRQGPDVGSQYRSAIFTTSDDQAMIANAYIAQLTQGEVFARPIVTTVASLEAFYQAEDYHQDYVAKHPELMYVVLYDLPKLEHLHDMFPELWREGPPPAREAS